MEQLVRLNLLGITYNQIESGVYALILEEPVSKKRLPIVIGYLEAQSIECKLQEVKTPRPLTHDIMVTLISGLNARLDKIVIHQLPTGVFAANLHLIDELGREFLIDSRSSDAIALAIRANAPIFAPSHLIEKVGDEPDSRTEPRSATVRIKRGNIVQDHKKSVNEKDYSKMSLADLHAELLKSVGEEKYEDAAKIKAEIEKRERGNK